MDAERLKLHAELLEQEIQENCGASKDVEWLAAYPPLVDAMQAAKRGEIGEPRELGDGLGWWVFESNIQSFKGLAHRLCQFELLLRGWSLSEDD